MKNRQRIGAMLMFFALLLTQIPEAPVGVWVMTMVLVLGGAWLVLETYED